jgi:ribosomally synthesized peptide (two-chain TOMM family)
MPTIAHLVKRRDPHTTPGSMLEVPANGPVVTTGRPEDWTAASKTNADWQPAWLRAIALAWSDPNLMAELVGVDAKGEPKAKAFLQKHCDYTVPAHLRLEARADTGAGAGWYPGGVDANPDTWVWKVSQTELVMYVPVKPDVSQQAVALAAYEAIGRVYPFTTCC